MLVETKGVPIALEVGPAQRHEVKLLAATLEAVVVEPPDPNEQKQHLSLDKAYAGEPAQQLAEEKGYEVHIPDKANAKNSCFTNWDAYILIYSIAMTQLIVLVRNYGQVYGFFGIDINLPKNPLAHRINDLVSSNW